MDLGELIPIVAIIATALVILSVIRLRREQLRVDQGRQEPGGAESRLADENKALRLNVQRLEERMAVLERIATDPAERTAREIENLRQD